jgi:apoptosis regulator BAX
MVNQVPVDSPYETFSDVAKELFADGVYNWGRIVTLFYFTYKLILKVNRIVDRYSRSLSFQSLRDEPASFLRVLIEWTVRFVREIVAPWIVRKGGWVSVTEWYLSIGGPFFSSSFYVKLCHHPVCRHWAFS